MLVGFDEVMIGKGKTLVTARYVNASSNAGGVVSYRLSWWKGLGDDRRADPAWLGWKINAVFDHPSKRDGAAPWRRESSQLGNGKPYSRRSPEGVMTASPLSPKT